MTKLIFLPPAAAFIKNLKDGKFKLLYQKAIDDIMTDHTLGELKTGDLSGVYGYDIYYNKAVFEIIYSVKYVKNKTIVVILTGTAKNLFDQLKNYM